MHVIHARLNMTIDAVLNATTTNAMTDGDTMPPETEIAAAPFHRAFNRLRRLHP
jgi:hypothetical protein